MTNVSGRPVPADGRPGARAADESGSETGAPLVLVAEDDEIIAMDVGEALRGLGIEVAGPFPTRAALANWLAGATPDVAVLDLHLRDGSCRDLIGLLRTRDVPIVLCSGSRDERPDGLEADHHLDKPYDVDRLGRLVLRLARAPGPGRRKR